MVANKIVVALFRHLILLVLVKFWEITTKSPDPILLFFHTFDQYNELELKEH